MARTARIKSESGYYHVMLRGNNRNLIFKNKQDRLKFLKLVQKQVNRGFISVIAYCLMDNHLHMLLRENDGQLTAAMQSLSTAYAIYFNKKYNRTGHLFQNRFESETIDDEKYLFAALRYIHQNPVKAGICDEVENYQWSSDPFYRDPEINTFIDKSILTFINPSFTVAVEEYTRLVKIPEQETFLEMPDDQLTDEGINHIVEAELKIAGIKDIASIKKYKSLPATVCILHNKHGLSIRRIAAVLGISKGSVQNMVQKKQ